MFEQNMIELVMLCQSEYIAICSGVGRGALPPPPIIVNSTVWARNMQ